MRFDDDDGGPGHGPHHGHGHHRFHGFTREQTRGGENLRWETNALLVFNDQGKKKQTLVWTPKFDVPRPFYVQLLFASTIAGPGGSTLVPALPFQPFSSARIQITLTRYIDDYGNSQEDSYIVNGFSPTATEPAWLPVAIVTARKVVITAEIVDSSPGHTTQFVDASISLVDAIDTPQIIQARYAPSVAGSDTFLANVFGFGDVPQVVRTAQSATAVQLLPVDQTRRQFWVSNEGTARLALRFSSNDPDVTPGSESWDVILDAKGGAFSRYQSPLDSFWGEVRGIWETAGAGFALASGAIIE